MNSLNVKKIFTLGFCWGGLHSINAAINKNKKLIGAASVHGAFLENNMGEKVKIPTYILNSGDDPDLSTMYKLMKNKEFGKFCK